MPRSLTPTQVRLYCAQRLPSVLPEVTVQILTEGLVALCDAKIPLPLREGRILYFDLSLRCGLAINALRPAHQALVPELQMVPIKDAIHLGGGEFRKVHPMALNGPISDVEDALVPALNNMLSQLEWWTRATRTERLVTASS